MPDPLSQSILCPILIGRDAQLAALSRLLDQAREPSGRGHGQIALISGEAGIGKSRLVTETKRRAAEQGMAIRQGNCFEPDRTLPYAPFLDLLRTAHSETPQLTNLVALLSGQQAQADGDPEAAKRRLFTALADFLHSPFAIDHSQLIIIEDLHWCDESSLEFLHFFARHLHHQPLLLLLTYRSSEVTSTLQQLLAQLDRLRLTTELTLPRLPATDAAAMIQAIFAQPQPVQPEFVAKLYNLTEGNPFFLEETLKALVAAGEIYFTEGSWTRKAIDQLHIPRTVQVAVAQRTVQLSAAARRLLTIAAVAGRRFDFALLQAITGHDEAQLIELIKELLRAQLVVEESAETFAFRHALTRQAVYHTLLGRERRLHHAAIAECLEASSSNPAAGLHASLAYHFEAAEVWDKTLHYARRAGEEAQRLHAPSAVIEHFTRALTATSRLGVTTAINATSFLALAQTRQGASELAQARLTSIFGDPPLPVEPAELSTLTLRQRLYWFARAELALHQGDPTGAALIVNQLIAAAQQAANDEPAVVARLWLLRAQTEVACHQLDSAFATLQIAHQAAVQQQARPILWRVEAWLGQLHGRRGEYPAAETHFSTAHHLVETLAATLADGEARDQFLAYARSHLPAPLPVTPRRATKAAFAGLTEREREVAALIAQGKSDREIAEILVLSKRTASTHVTNILNKLGFSSRTQIAAWAVEKGL